MPFLKSLKDAFFPEGVTCIVCDGEVHVRNRYSLCADCSFELNNRGVCERCGKQLLNEAAYCEDCKETDFYFERARSALVYRGGTVKLVYGLKFGRKRYLAANLGAVMADRLTELGWTADLLVPVPLSAKRLKERGYNQSAELARAVSGAVGIPVGEALLKTRDLPEQARLNRKERFENIKSCFARNDAVDIKGKTVILIDDVITTGATADECAHTLRRGGAGRVLVFTLASGVMKKSLQ
ncbi:MAG: ComF family protein [Clostridiales bacterium]|jgi:ComF family protein|nr:ComF family protein [Clostridiales bacterium]